MRSRNKVKLLAVLTAMNLVFTIQPFAGEWRQDGINGAIFWKMAGNRGIRG